MLCPTCHSECPASGPPFIPRPCPHCGAEVWRERVFGHLELREMLGRGAMAVVFCAFDPARGHEVALKIIRPPSAAEPGDLAAFAEAAERLVSLRHPHCARVFAAGIEGDFGFVAMEYLPVRSLASRLEQGELLSELETLDLALQAAAALEAAHAAGLPHRDFQPHRVRYAADGTIRITGLAEDVFLDCAAAGVGIVRGRLCYAPPERLFCRPEDARSEMYALAATLFEAFTGLAPHGGEPHGEMIRDLHDSDVLRIEAHGRPLRPATAAVLNRMLSVEPLGRPQAWADARSALGFARAAVPDPAAPPRRAAPIEVPAPEPPAPPVFEEEAPVAAAPAPGLAPWVTLILLALLVIAAGIVAWARWWRH
jgi:serine/threonine-protein kinase